MSEFDPYYFKKKDSINRAVDRKIENKFKAWQLSKDYYDGSRDNGYGGFKYDGRWLKLLPRIIKKYKLNNKSKVLDLGCKKGFFLMDLKKILPGIKVYGIENHPYPIKTASNSIKKRLILSNYYDLNFKDKFFDLVFAFNSVYSQNLGEIIKTLKEMQRISKKNYVVLAACNNEKERVKFYNWTLIGTTILYKKEWIKLFNKIGYKGDYYFSTAKTLGLK